LKNFRRFGSRAIFSAVSHCLAAPPGAPVLYRLLANQARAIASNFDLLNWSCIGTNQVFQGSADFIDPNAPDNSSGFYQIAPLAGPPTN